MSESNLLGELVLLLALAATGLALFERFRLPSVAGFLAAGVVAGPGVLGIVSEPDRVRALTEFGVVFLLFEIGLELPIDRLRRLWRTALIAGGAQVVLTTAIVAGISYALGLGGAAAFVLGAITAMSSTALVMRLLVERGQIDAPQGQLAIAVLIMQDLSIVPFLLILPLLASSAGGSWGEIGSAVVRIVVALGAVLGIVRFVVPRVLERVAKLRSPDLFSLLALLIVLASAYLAEELGLTLAVGALLAGVAASASPYAQQLFSEVVPLRGVLLGIFFTAVGMLFDPIAFVSHAPQVFGYLFSIIVLKAVLIALVARWLAGYGPRVGILAGLSLAQTGEFSLVLAETARAASLIDDSLHQIVIGASVLSLVATPWLMRIAPAVAERLVLRGHASGVDELDGSAGPSSVLLVGFGHAGQTLARTLKALSIDYRIIDANPQGVQAAHERGEPAVFGDATRPTVLHRLGVEGATLVAVAISDPLATRRIVSRIRAVAPDVPIIARTRYVQEVDPLSAAGARQVVAEEFEGSIELVSQALAHFQIPLGAIRNFTDALREEGYGAIRSGQAIDPWLVELLEQIDTSWVDVPSDFSGRQSLAALEVRRRCGASVLVVERDGENFSNPNPSFEIQARDRLLVLGDQSTLGRLEALLGNPSPDQSH